FFFSSRRRHTRFSRDWSSDVCSSDLNEDFVYKGKVTEVDGQYYKYYHGKIYKTDAAGTINYDENHHPTNEKPLDFSLTKNVFGTDRKSVVLGKECRSRW